MNRRPPRSTLFPTPPLFRSGIACEGDDAVPVPTTEPGPPLDARLGGTRPSFDARFGPPVEPDDDGPALFTEYEVEGRSEEHTSELQSRQYLVCRLLLEKKKK